jgi:hypothetical protein
VNLTIIITHAIAALCGAFGGLMAGYIVGRIESREGNRAPDVNVNVDIEKPE